MRNALYKQVECRTGCLEKVRTRQVVYEWSKLKKFALVIGVLVIKFVKKSSEIYIPLVSEKQQKPRPLLKKAISKAALTAKRDWKEKQSRVIGQCF